MKRMQSLLGVGFAWGGSSQRGNVNTPPQHVTVIVQENRTPDNLFGADAALIRAGAHIVTAVQRLARRPNCQC